MSSYDLEQSFSNVNIIKTNKRYSLSDVNLRDSLFVKISYQNLGFDLNEFMRLLNDEQLKYNNTFIKTKTMFEETTDEFDNLLGDDTCKTIMEIDQYGDE